MLPKWIKDYFTFTYKERIALIVLLSIIGLVFLMPSIIPAREWKASEKDIAAFEKLAHSIRKDSSADDADQNHFPPHYTQPSVEGNYEQKKLFAFDPNTASAQQWERLGLREKTIATIGKYLARGGRFKKPEDLRLIYGLHEDEYLRLKPYIRIFDYRTIKPYTHTIDSAYLGPSTFVAHLEKKIEKVELNDADTSAFIQLPGIGSKLANRIIRFRDKLGGFYSVDQVGETYGLPDSTFQKIKPFLILGNTPWLRININTADATRLKEHPYIGGAVARSIIEYRAQHGPFRQVDDLMKVSSILPDQLKRLLPYLSID